MSKNPWSSGETCDWCEKEIVDCKCFSDVAVSAYAIPAPDMDPGWYESGEADSEEKIRETIKEVNDELDKRKENEDVEVQD